MTILATFWPPAVYESKMPYRWFLLESSVGIRAWCADCANRTKACCQVWTSAGEAEISSGL